MTPRLLTKAVLLGVLMACAVGCQDVNQIITGRQPTCNQTPDVCIRVADLATELLRDMKAPTITGTTTSPRVCDAKEVGDTRCWLVHATYQGGETDVLVHEHADGSLGIHHTSKGAPPDT